MLSNDKKVIISVEPLTVVGTYVNPLGNFTDVLPVHCDADVEFNIFNDSVSPGCILVATNLVAPAGKVKVKKFPKLQSILAVLDEIVNGNTCPVTLPENIDAPIVVNSTVAEDERIKLPVMVWFPLNELLPVVAYDAVNDDNTFILFVTPAKLVDTLELNDCVKEFKLLNEIFTLALVLSKLVNLLFADCVNRFKDAVDISIASNRALTDCVNGLNEPVVTYPNDAVAASNASNLWSTDCENGPDKKEEVASTKSNLLSTEVEKLTYVDAVKFSKLSKRESTDVLKGPSKKSNLASTDCE